MFNSTVLLAALSLAAFGVAAAGSAGDGNLKLDGCDPALLQHVRDPLARTLNHLTPSERLLFELDNETNVDPYAFVNNNPVEVNIMLMSEPIVPSPTISSAMETATSGADESIKGNAIIDESGHEPDIHSLKQCTPAGRDCDVEACIATTTVLCDIGEDGRCQQNSRDRIPRSRTSIAGLGLDCSTTSPERPGIKDCLTVLPSQDDEH